MSLLDEFRADIAEVQGDEELNALRFRESATWSDGTSCRFSVQDLNKGKDAVKFQTAPLPTSLRLLRVHPADSVPAPLSSVAYQGGLLVLGLWGDTGITGQAPGICRLVDGRAYPVQASVGGGPMFRLRIDALGALPGGAGGEGNLTLTVNDSHRASLPPGVHLQPGDLLTTTAGDQYQVVPPVQRDALGDTLGLSWRGAGTPPADPTPDTPPTELPPVSPWWEQTS